MTTRAGSIHLVRRNSYVAETVDILFGIAVVLALLSFNHAHRENVKIGIPSLTVTMMPVAVAKEQGFFQKEGLNVETVLMPASLNIKVLLSGDIQYATTITAGVVANVRGVNTRVVMCFVDRPLLDLVGNPEIGSIADLKGKLVAISSRGGLHDVTMRRIFVQSGMDPSQATFITVGEQGAMLNGIKSGRIAAGLLNPPQILLPTSRDSKIWDLPETSFAFPAPVLSPCRKLWNGPPNKSGV